MSRRTKITIIAVLTVVLAAVAVYGRGTWQWRAISAMRAASVCPRCSITTRALEAVRAFASPPTTPGLGPTIIGGTETKEGEYPSVGAVLSDGKLLCTGTLLKSDVVLTAAHCAFDDDGKLRPIEGIAFTLSRVAHVGKRFPATEYVFPPQESAYDHSTLENDILLVRISSTPATSFYSLPDAADDGLRKGEDLVFVGYGRTRKRGQLVGAGIQRKVTMPIDSPDAKVFAYRSTKKNTCWGDSGGPAILGKAVVGVTSWGDSNCREYGVDTRVSAHVSWLRDYI